MNTNDSTKCPKCGAALPADAPHGLCPACLVAMNFASRSGISGAENVTALPPPSIEELAPHFPQLELIECLGRGGMGLVYKARQSKLNRIVALKILAPERERDPAFAERFTREARALAKLSHPNIVTIHDFGVADNLFYLIMEFVDGMNLRELMNAARISTREALAIVPQICDALQYAHDNGVIHRDIKPENILLDRRGNVKVADFGLAKLTAPSGAGVPPACGGAGVPPADAAVETPAPRDATRASLVMGTPLYMAPEQREHPSEVDHRADIYSLGVVFYQMLTGELPGQKIEPPSKKVVVDVRLDEVVLRALEKKPELRFQQVGDVKTLVETIVSTPSPQQKTSPPRGAIVAQRGGKAVINWLGALSMYFVVLFIAGAFVIIADLIVYDRIHASSIVITSLGALLVVCGSILRGLLTPREHLTDLDAPQVPSVGKTGATMNQKLKKLFLVTLPVAVFTVVIVHTFFLQAFEAMTDAAAPEIPRGSRCLVWKLEHNFAPGDLIAYRHHQQVNLGRVASAGNRDLMVQRNHSPEVAVPRDAVLGKVISIYWRASGTTAAVPQIESVVVSKDKAVVKQRSFHGEGLLISFGSPTNRWSPSGVYSDHLFEINLEWPWFHSHDANWVIKTRHGTYANYRLDVPLGGSVGQLVGKIVFHPGRPAPEADGYYVIGEFRPENGQPLPISVTLVRDGPNPQPSDTMSRANLAPSEHPQSK